MIIKVLDHGEVELIDCLASDQMVLRAMLVSTGKDVIEGTEIGYDLSTSHTFGIYASNPNAEIENKAVERNRGRINYLMREHHGTPFEHNVFIFRVKAPIFVLREWHRHRIGWSYNEQSGRYMELGDQWYIPSIDNVRTRIGKPGHYVYENMIDQPDGRYDAEQFLQQLQSACGQSYKEYKFTIEGGIAPEQARLFLHVNHYSTMYATCNARSLMHFLNLRNAPTAQWEIQQYAKVLEDIFAQKMPVTWHAFVNHERVAP